MIKFTKARGIKGASNEFDRGVNEEEDYTKLVNFVSVLSKPQLDSSVEVTLPSVIKSAMNPNF